MTTPSLTNVTSFGKILTEEINLDGGFFTVPVPATISSGALNASVWGRLRTITITGRFSGTEAERDVFITEIETIANSSSEDLQLARTYTSSHGNTYSVQISSFSYSYDSNDTNAINYKIIMLEGSIATLETYKQSINNITP